MDRFEIAARLDQSGDAELAKDNADHVRRFPEQWTSELRAADLVLTWLSTARAEGREEGRREGIEEVPVHIPAKGPGSMTECGIVAFEIPNEKATNDPELATCLECLRNVAKRALLPAPQPEKEGGEA